MGERINIEAVKLSRRLYDLAEQVRVEAAAWRHPASLGALVEGLKITAPNQTVVVIVGQLDHAVELIEAAARYAATDPEALDYADAYADAAELMLRRRKAARFYLYNLGARA